MTAGLRIPTLLLAGALAVAGAGVPAPTVLAQEQASLEEYELEYQAALRRYEAALAAREVAQSRLNREMREYEGARGTERQGQAYSEFLDASTELSRMDRRVERVLEQVEEAGTAFLAALEDRRRELLAQADTLPPGATGEAEDIVTLLRDLRHQIDEVDTELARAREPQAPQAPGNLTIEADATREELQLMAQILEDRAARYDSTVVDLEEELEHLRERRRNDRRVEDLVAGLDRFDDRALPVVPRRVEGGTAETGAEGGEATDTTGVNPREMTLGDRIENLESLRDRLLQYKNLVLEQARVIRRRIGSGGLDGRYA